MYSGEDGVEPQWATGGKLCDPVHGVAAKSLLGHRKWLQQAWGGLCAVFGALADLTLTTN